MEWVHCNSCYVKPAADRNDVSFSLTSCGHIFCCSCQGKDFCTICNSKCSLVSLSKQLMQDVKVYFSNPVSLFEKLSVQIERVYSFQKTQKERLFKHQREQIQLQSQKLIGDIKSLERDVQELETRLQSISIQTANSHIQQNPHTRTPVAISRSTSAPQMKRSSTGHIYMPKTAQPQLSTSTYSQGSQLVAHNHRPQSYATPNSVQSNLQSCPRPHSQFDQSHSQAHPQFHSQAYSQANTQSHSQAHPQSHSQTHPQSHSQVHPQSHSQAYSQAHPQSHSHTYSHAHPQSISQNRSQINPQSHSHSLSCSPANTHLNVLTPPQSHSQFCGQSDSRGHLNASDLHRVIKSAGIQRNTPETPGNRIVSKSPNSVLMKRPRTTTMNTSAGIGPTRLCIRTPPIDGKIGIIPGSSEAVLRNNLSTQPLDREITRFSPHSTGRPPIYSPNSSGQSPSQFTLARGRTMFSTNNTLRSVQSRSHSSSPKVWSTPSMGSSSSLPITSARKTH